MLYKLQNQYDSLSIVVVDHRIVDGVGVVVTDRNAASDICRFGAAPGGLALVDEDVTFAEYWTDANPIAQMNKKAMKCAEVLVPDVVPPRHFRKILVANAAAQAVVEALKLGLPVEIDRHQFFNL